MPVRDPFPGVYVEEIPSGVRTIHAAPTAVTAFVGRTPRGPVDRPVAITSFAEYERSFGGLDTDSAISFAVRDFFLNGGQQACIVRRWVAAEAAAATDFAGHATYDFDGELAGCTLHAASPGAWGNDLEVRIDRDGVSASAAKAVGLSADEFFHLTIISYADEQVGKVVERKHALTERFRNVSLHRDAKAHRLDQMLATSALLVLAGGEGLAGGTGESKASAPAGACTAKLVAKGIDSASLTKPEHYLGEQAAGTGIHALKQADSFQMLCLPPDVRAGDVVAGVYEQAAQYCADNRAFLICDPPTGWDTLWQKRSMAQATTADLGTFAPEAARHAAVYYPRVNQIDPLRRGADAFAACGAIAGIIARTDATRGVWKSPAGIDAKIEGINSLRVVLDDADTSTLADNGINVMRSFPASGPVVWGARTIAASAQCDDSSRYVAVCRLMSFVESSIVRGTQWTVFEANTEQLWAKLRLAIGDFLLQHWREGAFVGSKQEEGFAVACGPETTTPADVEAGRVNVQISFAPIKPAEFVVIKLVLRTVGSAE